jgi:K+/H+ antiporter YhaU regulatory subunit KhtT
MGHGVEVTELFGIGKKYTIGCSERQQLAIIVRDDGIREIYVFDRKDSEHPKTVIELDEEETRRVAAVLGGTFFGD